MVVPTGKWRHCLRCGRLFPERDCISFTCGWVCEDAWREELEGSRRQIEEYLAREKWKECPDYQI